MNVTRLDKEDLNKPLVNRVAQSGLITLDLEKFISPKEILELDIKDFLFQEILLKEKEFRQKLKEINWEGYQNKIVAVHCSTDAILQQWAFMLIVKQLLPHTNQIFFGTKEEVEQKKFIDAIQQINVEKYKNERVIVKGCSSKAIADEAYLEISKRLIPVVKSLLFGEACSTVPVYKQPK